MPSAKKIGQYKNDYGYAGSKRKEPKFKGKVVLLINEVTQSAGEFYAMGCQRMGIVLIGSTTAGADGNVSKIYLPGIKTMISGLGVYYPDGTPTQRVGIIADIKVERTIQGIKEGRDEILERAIEYIKTGK